MAKHKSKKSVKKFMRKKGKTKGKTISRAARKKYATIKEKKDGTMMYRFPMPDKAHARNALARLSQAKGLSGEERMKIMRRACTMMADGKSDEYKDCMARNKA